MAEQAPHRRLPPNVAREVIARLRSLRQRVNLTTPHELLSQAVDVMRIRPVLLARRGRQAERALANVELYLSLSAEYALREDHAELVATAGVADVLTTNGDGWPAVIVDWKSDVAPEPATIEHYRVQVHAYLAMTGAERGLIVMMTTVRVIEVAPAPAAAAA